MKNQSMKIILFALAFFALALAINAKPKVGKPKIQTAKVQIGEQGFKPYTIKLKRNIIAQITFLRTTDATCATEVVFASSNITRELPLNKAVIIKLTPKKSGEIAFACGMGMMRGKLIVE